jgi:hypothetical protein
VQQGGCHGRRHRGPGRQDAGTRCAGQGHAGTHPRSRAGARPVRRRFAIIITLLVLEIHVPELTQGHSPNEALAEVRPSFNAFVITFILTGMYCGGHRDLFALICRTDRGLVWLNILCLLPLCLLPFGAGMPGRYDQGAGGAADLRPAAGRDRGHARGDLVVRHQPSTPPVAAAG